MSELNQLPSPVAGSAASPSEFLRLETRPLLNLRLDGADDLLARRVQRSIRDLRRQPLSAVSVAVHEGRVTLRGKVPSYYMKQLAQHTAQQVSGIAGIDSQLTVE